MKFTDVHRDFVTELAQWANSVKIWHRNSSFFDIDDKNKNKYVCC